MPAPADHIPPSDPAQGLRVARRVYLRISLPGLVLLLAVVLAVGASIWVVIVVACGLVVTLAGLFVLLAQLRHRSR